MEWELPADLGEHEDAEVEDEGPAAFASTPASRLRTVEKRIRSAVHQSKQANARLAALVRVRKVIAQGQADLEEPTDVVSLKGQRGLYSRAEAKLLLEGYVSGRDKVRFADRPRSASEIDPEETGFDESEARYPTPAPDPRLGLAAMNVRSGYQVNAMPRTRNVFKQRLSASARGRKNRGALPRGGWWDTQRAGQTRRSAAEHATPTTPRRPAAVLPLGCRSNVRRDWSERRDLSAGGPEGPPQSSKGAARRSERN